MAQTYKRISGLVIGGFGDLFYHGGE